MSDHAEGFVAGQVLQLLRDNFPTPYDAAQIAQAVDSTGAVVALAVGHLEKDSPPRGALVERLGEGENPVWRARRGVTR